MRYIVRLSYDGADFSGWQVQPDAETVQGKIQDALDKLLRKTDPAWTPGKTYAVTGAGRTDSEVNAVNYIMHFDAPGLGMDSDVFIYKLNAILPSSIAVHEIWEAPVCEHPEDGSFVQDWHARYSAKSREYHYFIHFRKDPFCERFSWWHRQPLDVARMNEACRYLIGTQDFSCFEKTGGNNATSICDLTYARWEEYTPDHVRLMGYPCKEGDYIVFTVRANRFLRNMVRAIVGSMVEVGKGKHDPQWIAELIESKDRCAAGESVPGKALFLSDVQY